VKIMSTPQIVPLRPGIDLDQLCINTIRTLSIDAVQQAESGHPGTPMALAPGSNPEVNLIATGSEVILAVDAHERLLAQGIRSPVVSMPSWDFCDDQSQEYRDSVLSPNVKARVAVEQASTFGWERFVGTCGRVIGMKTFGASAPLKELQRKFGFEPDRVVAAAKEMMDRE
jgi:transketolase